MLPPEGYLGDKDLGEDEWRVGREEIREEDCWSLKPQVLFIVVDALFSCCGLLLLLINKVNKSVGLLSISNEWNRVTADMRDEIRR